MIENLSELIEKADKGDVEAMVAVAQYIVWDDQTQPIEEELLERAKAYFNKAIEAGNAEAMVSVGAMYYVGRGVQQDYKKAVHWYTKAANHGSITAMSNLGYCYYYGRDIPVDMEKAYQMFSKAAILGDPISYYKIGDMYMWGKYVDKDPVSAFRMYVAALDLVIEEKPLECYPDICFRIGSCLHQGNGVEVDLVEAEKFLAEAKFYFVQRKESGDTLTDGVLKRATDEWVAVVKELEAKS